MDPNNSAFHTKLIDILKKRINSTLSQFQLLEACVNCSLFTSTLGNWIFTGLSGCLSFIVDYKEQACLLTLHDAITCKKLFEFKTYPNFQAHYKKLSDSFHTFELNKGYVGLKFSNYLAAEEFDVAIQKYPEEKKKVLFSVKIGYSFTVKNKLNADPQTCFRKFLKICKPSHHDLKKVFTDRLCFDLNKPSYYRIPACFDFNKIYKTFKNTREKDLEQISVKLCFKRTLSENSEINLSLLKSIIEIFKDFQFKQKNSITNVLKANNAKHMEKGPSLLKSGRAGLFCFTSASNTDVSNHLNDLLKQPAELSNTNIESINHNLSKNDELNKTTPIAYSSKVPPVPIISLPNIPSVPKINIPVPKIAVQKVVLEKALDKSENEKPQIQEVSIIPLIVNEQPEEAKFSMLDMLKNVKLSKAEKVEDKSLLLKSKKNTNDIEYALSQHLKWRDEQMNGGAAYSHKIEENDDDDDW